MDPLAGEWKNFEIRSIQRSDFPLVLEHLRSSFHKDEPTQIIAGTSPDRMTDLDNRILAFLDEDLSFMAICKSTKKIASVVIMAHEYVDKKPIQLIPISPITPPVRSFMSQLANSVNIFQTYGVTEYGEIYILSTGCDFRNLGLASEMFRRGVEFLWRCKKQSIVQCTFSNPYSRRIGQNAGFVEVARMKYCEGRDKGTGELLFPTAPPDQFVNLTVLDLRNK